MLHVYNNEFHLKKGIIWMRKSHILKKNCKMLQKHPFSALLNLLNNILNILTVSNNTLS